MKKEIVAEPQSNNMFVVQGNENLESNPTKARIRTIKTEQTFSAGFDKVEGINLCGCYGILDNEMVDKGAFRGIPVKLDCVENKPNIFMESVTHLPPSCTPIQGDIFKALLHKIVRSYGIGSIREEIYLGKYNYADVDLCTHGTRELVFKITTHIKNATQKKAMFYVTFQLNGSRVEDGYKGAYELLGEKWTETREPDEKDVADAVRRTFQEAFKLNRMTTSYHPVLDIVYRGGYNSMMITLGWAKNIRNVKKVMANWIDEHKQYREERLSDLSAFKREVKSKLTLERRNATRKLNKRAKRQENFKMELQRKLLVRNTCKTLKDNGWDNSRIAQKLNLNPYQVRAILAQFSGKLAKKRGYIIEPVKVTGGWVRKVMKQIA